MIRRATLLVVVAVFAIALIGMAIWSWSTENQAHQFLSAAATCAKASKPPSAARSAYDACLAAHGLTTMALADSCENDPNVLSTRQATSAWANAFATCIRGHGAHATIVKEVDIPSGEIRYGVRWGRKNADGSDITDGSVTTERTST